MLLPAIARHLFMKTRFDLTCWLALLLSCLALPTLRAAQFGPYTYSIYGEGNTTSITITGYDGMMAGVGPANVPASIEGVQVIAIGDRAFSGITNLTGIILPASLIHIGSYSFSGCTGFTSLSVPEGITFMDTNCFSRCTGLASLSLPSTINWIGYRAFEHCANLRTALFTGNAPAVPGFQAFHYAPTGFTIYFLKGKTGFTGLGMRYPYSTKMIDPVTQPAAFWLLFNGQDSNADLNTDINLDGVSLLMAYALNLDPRLNLSGRLPQATLQGDALGMTFYAASPSLTYRVEASADLVHWSTDGITQTALNRDGMSTATVPRSGPAQFLRLAVSR